MYVGYSLVPRLPYLFNVHKKRGGSWYTKSHALRHTIEPYRTVTTTGRYGSVGNETHVI